MQSTDAGTANTRSNIGPAGRITDEHLAMVRATLARGPGDILALHVPERHRGASVPVRDAFVQSGFDVQGLNQAYEDEHLAQALSSRMEGEMALPRIFSGQGMRIVYMTGWGSDPISADALLKAVYPYVMVRSNLRLVVMNNASPVPHMFTSDGPTAHPDPEEFARHVARLAGIDRSRVDLRQLERHDLGD